MKYCLFTGSITEDVQGLIEFVNDYEEGNICIGLFSDGGKIAIYDFLLEMLNANKHRIKLSVVGSVESAAFFLWHEFKGYKDVKLTSMGMAHMSFLKSTIIHDGKPYHKHFPFIQNIKEGARRINAIAKEALTEEQYKAYLNHEDVHIGYQQMKQIALRHNKKNGAKPLK